MTAVPREAREPLQRYWKLLRRWSRAINLVAPCDVDEGWKRHIEDSIQLAPLFPPSPVTHHDLGSGGGLPAIPIAICRRVAGHEDTLILIEADMRKAAFLRTACRHLGLSAEIVPARIEDADTTRADVVTARALAPLDALLSHVERRLDPAGVAILPKGRRFAEEVEAARARWRFDVREVPSLTDVGAVILVVSNLRAIA